MKKSFSVILLLAALTVLATAQDREAVKISAKQLRAVPEKEIEPIQEGEEVRILTDEEAKELGLEVKEGQVLEGKIVEGERTIAYYYPYYPWYRYCPYYPYYYPYYKPYYPYYPYYGYGCGCGSGCCSTVSDHAVRINELEQTRPKIYTGEASNWKLYANGRDIYIDIDLSSLNLQNAPTVWNSLTGTGGHWLMTGINSIYNLSPSGYRVYLNWEGDDTTNMLSYANARNYVLHFFVLSND